MAATATPYLPHERRSDYNWILAAVGMLAFAVGCGYALATGEIAGLYVTVSLVCALAVLFDFRIGTVLLIAMLPVSASDMFPRNLFQITGLNPLNLLLMATIGSYLIRGRLQRAGPVLTRPLLWLYIAPIVLAALIGMQHLEEIPPVFFEREELGFHTETGYLLVMLLKPLVIVAIAVMLAAAVARSQNPERFLVPIALSMWPVALLTIGFVAASGVGLDRLASADERRLLAQIGIHPNDLGRLFVTAYALLLFVWWDARRPALRLFLLLTMALLCFALLLTFSRAAFGGFVLANALFLLWKFNSKTLALAVLGIAALALVLPDAVYDRITLGFDTGDADVVSAGRVGGIWLPLLPELAKSPVWGHGISSMLWSYPVQAEIIERTGHPHSAYLEALLDMGLVGTALLAAYFLHVWRGFRSLGGNADLIPEMRSLFQGAAAVLLVFLVTGLVGSSFRPEPEFAYLWLAIGLMYGARARRPAS